MTENSHSQNTYKVYETSSRTDMIEFLPANARKILDVGCSVGNFAELIKSRQNAEVWGVEVDEQAAEIAAPKMDKLFCASFDQKLDLPKKFFDCIFLNDVLEHMYDPFNALLYCKELLNDEGQIIASIPNVRFFENVWRMIVEGNWDYRDSGILDRTHIRFFTLNSIRKMFDKLGYRVEKIKGINSIEFSSPKKARKFKILNTALLKRIDDMRWLQFAVIAKPK